MARDRNALVEVEPGVIAKPKRVTQREAMDRAEMFVAKNLPKYIRKLDELAMGVYVEKQTKDGPEVYLTPPNPQVLEYLIERGMGKVPQRYELTGEEGGPVQVIPWLPAEDTGEVIDGTARTLPIPASTTTVVHE